MKKTVLFAIVLFLYVQPAFSQDSQKLPTLIPPSPNVASLAQYADIPVSNYTGVPNISVPLYTLKSGDIEMPISLSYHASGIKVGQEASWVGLGWSLNAGGMITRQIIGVEDFESHNGFIYSLQIGTRKIRFNNLKLIGQHIFEFGFHPNFIF